MMSKLRGEKRSQKKSRQMDQNQLVFDSYKGWGRENVYNFGDVIYEFPRTFNVLQLGSHSILCCRSFPTRRPLSVQKKVNPSFPFCCLLFRPPLDFAEWSFVDQSSSAQEEAKEERGKVWHVAHKTGKGGTDDATRGRL